LAPIATITLLAAFIRTFAVSMPLSGDEMTAYLYFIRGGWQAIFRDWAEPFPAFLIDIANHPVNNILTFISINTFGEVTDWSLPLPAYLLGCLTIPLAYRLSFECSKSHRAALFAAFALALANGHVQWSGISRGYSTMIFFEVILLCAVIRFQRKPGIPTAIVAISSGTLMVYSQFVSLAVIASIALAIFVLSALKRSYINGERTDNDRLESLASNAFVILTIGFCSSLIYLPQFSVLDTLLSIIQEGKLPAETFGQIPGFSREDSPSEHTNPTWSQVADFVMGMGPVSGFMTLGLWVAGLILIGKRNTKSAIILASIALVPATLVLATQASPRGRYFLILLPVYVVPLGFAVDALLSRTKEWLDKILKTNNSDYAKFTTVLGFVVIAALNLPATIRFLQDPHPERSGSWHLAEAEAFIQREASPDDLVWLFPVGPPETAEQAPGYLQPYGHLHSLGGFGKLDYKPATKKSTRIYCISPRPVDFESEFLPQNFQPEPIAQFGNSIIYRGDLLTPNNRRIPTPESWTLTSSTQT
jgi:hypothetical protein